MTRPHGTVYQLQEFVTELCNIERNHQHIGRPRHENDVEHSFTIALFCWYIITKHNLKLDLALVMKYSLVHDFTERYAGDVNTFASEDERSQKVIRERLALERITTEFSDFDDMVVSLQDYEARKDEEAIFVWTIDKLQPLILGQLDEWRPYKRLEISHEALDKKMSELRKNSSKQLQDIFDSIVEYSKQVFYDQPEHSGQQG